MCKYTSLTDRTPSPGRQVYLSAGIRSAKRVTLSPMPSIVFKYSARKPDAGARVEPPDGVTATWGISATASIEANAESSLMRKEAITFPGRQAKAGSSLRRKAITYSANRLNMSRSLRIVLQLLAQPGHMHIDGPR